MNSGKAMACGPFAANLDKDSADIELSFVNGSKVRIWSVGSREVDVRCCRDFCHLQSLLIRKILDQASAFLRRVALGLGAAL